VARQEPGTRGTRGHATGGRGGELGWPDFLIWVLAMGAVAGGAAVWATDLPWGQMVAATAAAGIVATVVWTLCLRARRWEWRAVPPPSPSGILLGLGIPSVLIGTAVGTWLVVFGVDAVVLGIVALTAELRGHLRA
jgi:hypothetical protein